MDNKINIEEMLKEKYDNIEVPDTMFNINYSKLKRRKKTYIIVGITLMLLLISNLIIAISQSLMFIQTSSILSKFNF